MPESTTTDSNGSPEASETMGGEPIYLVNQQWLQVNNSKSSLGVQRNEGLAVSEGVVDTGASCAITNYDIANILVEITGRQIKEWPKPVIFQFANAGRDESIHYIDGGVFLGKISIVATAPCSLVSIWNLVQSNCSVHFQADCVQVIYHWYNKSDCKRFEKVLYSGKVWIAKKLWYLDLVALMQLELPSESISAQSIAMSDTSPHNIQAVQRKQRISDATVNLIRELHRRFNHQASPHSIAEALRAHVWLNAPDINASDIEYVFAKYPCLSCRLAKMKKLPTQLGSGIRASYIGERVSVDGVPVTPDSVEGYVGWFHFREHKSGFEYGYLFKFKTEFIDAVRELVSFFSLHGHRIRYLQFDAGTVETSKDSTAALMEMGIIASPAVPEKQNQNFTERSVQTRVYAVASMMLDQVMLGPRTWSWAVLAAIDAHNATYITDGASAIQHVTSYAPDLSKEFLFAFGTPVAVMDHRLNAPRFSPNAVFAVAIRSTMKRNGGTYVFIPGENRHLPMVRKDIRDMRMFLRQKPQLYQELALDKVFNKDGDVTMVAGGPDEFVLPVLPAHQSIELLRTGTVQERDDMHTVIEQLNQQYDRVQEQSTVIAPQDQLRQNILVDNAANPVAGRTRSRTHTAHQVQQLVDSLDEFDPISQLFMSVLADAQENGLNDIDLEDALDYSMDKVIESVSYFSQSQEELAEEEPTQSYSVKEELSEQIYATLKRKVRTDDNPTVTQALKTPEGRARWGPVIEKEFNQLVEKGVGREVKLSDIPRGSEILHVKIDLKTKHKADGTWDKDKARMCLMDNVNTFMTFLNTYAPTGNEITLKLLYQLAATLGWLRYGIDFVGAFLNIPLPPGMIKYMKLPSYFDIDGVPRYWLLLKAMYGLRESPAIFTTHVRLSLVTNGWTCLISDRAIFYKVNSHGDIGILYTHSDDERLFCSHQRVHNELVNTLQQSYEITSGHDESFVGYREIQLSDGTIHLSMPAKIDALCSDLIISSQVCALTPIAVGYIEITSTDISSKLANAEQISDLRAKLGSAIFLQKVLPQIQIACQFIAQRINLLTTYDLGASRRLRSYILSQRDRGLAYVPGNRKDLRLVFQCDAAFDVFTGSRSNGAYMATLGSHSTAAIVAKTFILPNVPTSSCEAETVAGASALKEMIYLREFMKEIGFEQKEPTVCYIDNQSMERLCSEYAGNLKKVKHILRLLNFMVYHTQRGVVKWVYTPTKELTIDVLTKIHGPETFIPFANKLVGPDMSYQVLSKVG